MKSRSSFLLPVFMLALMVAGCSDSPGNGAANKPGTVTFQIRWPDDAGLVPPSGETAAIREISINETSRYARAPLLDECETRNVVTIAVEVIDDMDRHLVSERFDCRAREGLIENVAAGPDRHFAVSALDPDGATRYYGEKAGVAIEAGFNDVGLIELAAVISPPIVVIAAPEDGGVYPAGTGISFSGSATDPEDGELAGDALVWRSDIDNELGTGTSVTRDDLSPGIHVITLTATDSDGDAGDDSISITITEAVNEPPEAHIERPFGGSRHMNNADIFFEGSAVDPEDGELTGSALVWTSDRDDIIGYGTVFFSASLSTGVHSITLTATDSEGASADDTVQITVIDPKLPDTGQRRSYTDVYGEDSDYSIHPQSYTKLDTSGRALSDSAVSWSMVRDNVTGLVWEVKTTDGSIHDTHDTYIWEDAAYEFIRILNEEGFGGFTDWRLPTIMELLTIIYADNPDVAIDTRYFPNLPDVDTAWYWSSTPLADVPDLGWLVNFRTGETEDDWLDDIMHHVRAVRGGIFPTGPFVDNGDGTVTDTATGLMWQLWERSYGSTWEAALEYCESLELAGYSDWRMPNRNELHSLVDYGTGNPAFPSVFDDNIDYPPYWGSTSSSEYEGEAYTVDFSGGSGRFHGKWDYNIMVRAVRGGR